MGRSVRRTSRPLVVRAVCCSSRSTPTITSVSRRIRPPRQSRQSTVRGPAACRASVCGYCSIELIGSGGAAAEVGHDRDRLRAARVRREGAGGPDPDADRPVRGAQQRRPVWRVLEPPVDGAADRRRELAVAPSGERVLVRVRRAGCAVAGVRDPLRDRRARGHAPL